MGKGKSDLKFSKLLRGSPGPRKPQAIRRGQLSRYPEATENEMGDVKGKKFFQDQPYERHRPTRSTLGSARVRYVR